MLFYIVCGFKEKIFNDLYKSLLRFVSFFEPEKDQIDEKQSLEFKPPIL